MTDKCLGVEARGWEEEMQPARGNGHGSQATFVVHTISGNDDDDDEDDDADEQRGDLSVSHPQAALPRRAPVETQAMSSKGRRSSPRSHRGGGSNGNGGVADLTWDRKRRRMEYAESEDSESEDDRPTAHAAGVASGSAADVDTDRSGDAMLPRHLDTKTSTETVCPAPSSSPTPTPLLDLWVCSCTFVNTLASVACDVCERRRPRSRISKPPAWHRDRGVKGSAGPLATPTSRRRGQPATAEGPDDETVGVCPISLEPMEDPVRSRKCGHCFDREAIELWIRGNGATGRMLRHGRAGAAPCPVCRVQIRLDMLDPVVLPSPPSSPPSTSTLSSKITAKKSRSAGTKPSVKSAQGGGLAEMAAGSHLERGAGIGFFDGVYWNDPTGRQTHRWVHKVDDLLWARTCASVDVGHVSLQIVDTAACCLLLTGQSKSPV